MADDPLSREATLQRVKDAGRFITGGKFPTALRAKTRLKEVIADDRAAVPCGRWVRKSAPPFEYLRYWLSLGFERPRYRWSDRR